MVFNQLCTIEIVIVTTCLVLLFIYKSAYADPILITDDANVSEKHTCIFETNIRFLKHSGRDFSFMPSCGVANHLEVSLGVSNSVQENIRNEALSFQIKRNLKAVEPEHVGAAVSLSVNRNIQGDEASDWMLNVPVTYVLNDRLMLNTNISYKHQSHDQYILGAVSSTYFITPKTTLSVEIFNLDHQAAFYQTVVGYELIKDVLAFELALGDRFKHHQDRWFGLGLSFSPQLF